MSDVTSVGKDKIQRWYRAAEQLVELDRQKNKACCEMSNAEQDLGKWLTPEDAKPGETFCVWFGDSLIQAVVGEQGRSSITVKVRKLGTSLVTL